MNTTKQALNYLFHTFAAHGRELYIVGGAVRDILLGEIPEDYDLTTDARPEEMVTWFQHTITLGSHFGTIGIILSGTVYEVTTYRTETCYGDGRHPDHVVFSDDFKADVHRRDFTINGLLMDENGVIIDCVGGYKDIEAGVLRAIGDPHKRFEEDKLRKWRCIRIAAEKSLELDEETRNAIDFDPDTKGVSIERIQKELSRIILSDKVGWGGYLLVRTGLFENLLSRIIPAYCQRCGDTLIDGFEIMAYLPKDEALRLAALIINMLPEERDQFLTAMGFSKAKTEMAKGLAHYCTEDVSQGIVPFKRALAAFGREKASCLVQFQEGFAYWEYNQNRLLEVKQNQKALARILERDEPLMIKDLAIDGHCVKTLGRKGQAVGEALQRCLEHTYKHPEENTQEKLIKYLERGLNE